ncbi:MAG: hypothetical protein COA44_04645 [Arcobacter sp.]|nr:MAG: hypothetical protein COA44_04645 [Arcobacter sp.]
MNGNVIAIVNEKGGVGKTNTSLAAAYALARAGKDFFILEIDSSNDSGSELHKSEVLKDRVQSVNLDKANDALSSAIFKVLTSDTTVIIDAGASGDTRDVIKKIRDLELENVSWCIPIQNSLKQMQNLRSTYKLIDDSENTYVVKNQVNTDEDYLQTNDDYIFFEGSKRYGRKSVRKELELESLNVIEIPRSEMFELAESSNETLYDIAQLAVEYSPKEAREIFAELGEAEFIENMARFSVAQQSFKLLSRLEKEFGILIHESEA